MNNVWESYTELMYNQLGGKSTRVNRKKEEFAGMEDE
jgi:hypothetical protein